MNKNDKDDFGMAPFKNWTDFLDQVSLHPAMWLGSISVNSLQHTIMGIRAAEGWYKIPKKKRYGGFDFEEFEKWVDVKFNKEHLSLNSFLLAQYIMNSDEKGLVEWFAWYRQFNERKHRP